MSTDLPAIGVRSLGGMLSLTVFCSAHTGIDPRYEQLAEEVGEEIGRRGWTLVWGAGAVSMMGAVARGARSQGARLIGVIPESLLSRELGDRDVHEFVVTRDMRQRKAIMDERSDAFLAMPGGIGTLEELLEVWTARTLGMHSKPVVILDPWGDFAPLREQIEHLVAKGFMRREAADELTWCVNVGEALDHVARSTT